MRKLYIVLIIISLIWLMLQLLENLKLEEVFYFEPLWEKIVGDKSP